MGAIRKLDLNPTAEFLTDFLSARDKYILILENPGNLDFNFLKGWLANNKSCIDSAFVNHGGVLFRNFKLTADDFKIAADLMAPSPTLKYTAGISPRTEFQDGIYLATTLPNKALIQQHSEMSYLPKFPKKAFFHCDIPAASGGETPVCSTRVFMKKLDSRIFKKFAKLGVMYIRNFGNLEGMPGGFRWQDAYETEDRRKVEEFCRKNNIIFEWAGESDLITKFIGKGVANHSVTGEVLWHNHCHIFNHYSEKPARPAPFLQAMKPIYSAEVYQKLLQAPVNKVMWHSMYGDGTKIEASVIDEINCIFESEKISYPWRKGDLIALDNLLSHHGRNPFEGERRTLAILKEEQSE
jgi:hypothetical protein